MTMKEHLTQTVNVSFLKMWIPIAVLLITVGIEWGSVQGSINLANAKIDTLIQANADASNRLQNIEAKQEQMSIDVAKLQQIIADAQARGLLTRANPPLPVLSYANLAKDISPTPSAGQSAIPASSVTYNTNYQIPATTPTPEQVPTEIANPTPTATPPNPIQGVSSPVETILNTLDL